MTKAGKYAQDVIDFYYLAVRFVNDAIAARVITLEYTDKDLYDSHRNDN